MATLVTGGAGYIGSHTVRLLLDQKEDVVVVDNLQSGHRESIKVDHFYPIDVRDKSALDSVFKTHQIEAVIHFAANSLVGESMVRPSEYYHNNVYGMMCLLDVMKNNHVNKIVFSSSAATYGNPKKLPIVEDDETKPTNPYGETKLAMEKMMQWYEQAYGIKYVSLRYFNAAGAHESSNIGEDHDPETHLIPLVLQVPLGLKEKIYIFGDDYPTKDGTCIRDYVHIMDLASAHFLALQYLREGGSSEILNLGNERGHSVNEVIETARRITNHPIPTEIKSRRIGDPAILIASSERAKRILGWKPLFASLDKMIEDAWRWHHKHPYGFRP